MEHKILFVFVYFFESGNETLITSYNNFIDVSFYSCCKHAFHHSEEKILEISFPVQGYNFYYFNGNMTLNRTCLVPYNHSIAFVNLEFDIHDSLNDREIC